MWNYLDKGQNIFKDLDTYCLATIQKSQPNLCSHYTMLECSKHNVMLTTDKDGAQSFKF